jgi:hypothetical protein
LDGRLQLDGENRTIAGFPLAFCEAKGGCFERLAQLLAATFQRSDLGLHRQMLAKPRGGQQGIGGIRDLPDFFAHRVRQVRHQQLQA